MEFGKSRSPLPSVTGHEGWEECREVYFTGLFWVSDLYPGWEEGSTSIAHKSWSQVSQLGWDPVEQGFLALDVHEEPAITHFPKPHLWKFWFKGQGRGPEILFPTSSRWCQHCRWVAPCFRGSEHTASIGPERQGIIFSHGEKPLPPKRKEWIK